MAQTIKKLQTTFVDFALVDPQLRASLALLYDKIYLPSLPDSEMSGCGFVTFPSVQMRHEYMRKADGVLGQIGLIARIPAPPVEEVDYVHEFLLKLRGELALPEKNLLMLVKARLELLKKEMPGLAGHGWYDAIILRNIYHAVCCEKAVAPLFLHDTTTSSQISVDDMTLVLHREILGYFLPDVGALPDQEILALRDQTTAERLGYLAYILELVGQWEELRNLKSISEFQRCVADRVKTRIMPSFVEFQASLESRKQLRGLQRVVAALSVKGSITEPKFWIGALGKLLGAEKDIARDKLEEATNRHRFLSFMCRLNDNSGI
jgi:hypothetical protein